MDNYVLYNGCLSTVHWPVDFSKGQDLDRGAKFANL